MELKKPSFQRVYHYLQRCKSDQRKQTFNYQTINKICYDDVLRVLLEYFLEYVLFWFRFMFNYFGHTFKKFLRNFHFGLLFWAVKGLKKKIVDNQMSFSFKVDLKYSLFFRYCGIGDPSWLELRNFIHFFSKNLEDSENSDFTSVFTSSIFAGFKTFVVSFLLQMSKVL